MSHFPFRGYNTYYYFDLVLKLTESLVIVVNSLSRVWMFTNVSRPPVYVIKREYESEEEGGGGRRFAVLGPKKVTGVGPTTNDGVPTTLKSVCGYCTSHSPPPLIVLRHATVHRHVTHHL